MNQLPGPCLAHTGRGNERGLQGAGLFLAPWKLTLPCRGGQVGGTLTLWGVPEVSGHLGTIWRDRRPLLAENYLDSEAGGRGIPMPGEGSENEETPNSSYNFFV